MQSGGGGWSSQIYCFRIERTSSVIITGELKNGCCENSLLSHRIFRIREDLPADSVSNWGRLPLCCSILRES